MKTYWPKEETNDRKWYIIDAKKQVLGRLATKIASLLIGKGKPTVMPSVDTGDFVVVLNAADIVLTGKKLVDKEYQWHTGYPSGFRSTTAGKLMKEKPEEVLWTAVYGMIPKNKLRDRRIKRLKIYTTGEHPHTAQQPVAINS